MNVRRFDNPMALLLSLLVLLGLAGAWNYAASMPGVDYYVFWATADATRNGTQHSIYRYDGQMALGRQYRQLAEKQFPGSRRHVASGFRSYLNTTATPFLYWVVGMFSSGDYEKDLTRWSTLTLFMFSLAILLLGRLLRIPWTMNLLLLLASLVWMEAMRSELRVANVNGVQLGLVVISLWLLRRDKDPRFAALGGAVTALTVVFKPNLGPIVVLVWGAWLVRGEWRTLALGTVGMAGGTALAVGLSSAWFGGPGIWLEWAGNLLGLMYAEMPAESGNIAASNAVASRLGPSEQVAVMLAWCAAALLLFWWGRRSTGGVGDSRERRTVEYATLLAVGCVIQMTVSTVIWLHYYLLLMPMIIVALRPWSDPPSRSWASVIGFRLLPVIAFVLLLDSPLSGFFDVEYVRYLEITTTTVITILLALGLFLLARPDPRLPGEPGGD